MQLWNKHDTKTKQQALEKLTYTRAQQNEQEGKVWLCLYIAITKLNMKSYDGEKPSPGLLYMYDEDNLWKNYDFEMTLPIVGTHGWLSFVPLLNEA